MNSDAPADANAALEAAFARLLAPLARLALARGIPHAAVDELLRAAFVAQAHAAHPGLPEHRRTSRVAAATGLNRREVKRLLDATRERGADAAPPRTPAAMVFAHWRASQRTKSGAPRALVRTGPAPSFEALAQEVTRDVHPRALLEELIRLKLVAHDVERDTVALVREAFVPRGEPARMAQWLGANVGDHLEAAAANVAGRDPQHFEQAIAADGLSAASVRQVRPLLAAHWRRLADELVPLLEQLVQRDADVPPAEAHRVRVGLFGYDTAPAQPEAPPPAARLIPARASTARKRKTPR